MSDMVIRSRLRDYHVRFEPDIRRALAEELSCGALAVIDRALLKRYQAVLQPVLSSNRFLAIDASETTKTLSGCQGVIEALVDRGFRRGERLLAIGGGVTQDITAFVAAILYRGVEWSFVPTTLLAQADSCIGSKTSINLGDKKNLIGNFYPPSVVYLDMSFLESLGEDDIRSGIGEMLHFFLYAGSPLADKIIADHRALLRDRARLQEHIEGSLAIKKSVIELDEFDQGERNKFNYGHTFGHALETITDYGIRHGQAVTVGMDLANYLSMRLGLLESRSFEEWHEKFLVNFPSHEWTTCDLERFFEALSKDKKNIGVDLVCILSQGPGRLVKHRLRLDATLKDLIAAYFQLLGRLQTARRQ